MKKNCKNCGCYALSLQYEGDYENGIREVSFKCTRCGHFTEIKEKKRFNRQPYKFVEDKRFSLIDAEDAGYN